MKPINCVSHFNHLFPHKDLVLKWKLSGLSYGKIAEAGSANKSTCTYEHNPAKLWITMDVLNLVKLKKNQPDFLQHKEVYCRLLFSTTVSESKHDT